MANTQSTPVQVRILINEIENSKFVTNESLVQILKSLDLKVNDFASFSDFNHDPALSYGRTKLYQGKNFVIYLMSWGKDDFTAIHNHGQCDWGAVCFLGEVNHNLYRIENGRILLADKSIIPRGTVAPVKGDLVHAMGNLSEVPAMSLHIYGSNNNLRLPNSTSNIYELEKKQVRVTTGEAYINGSESLFEPLEKISTNEKTLTDYLTIILPYYQRNHITEMVNFIESIMQFPTAYFSE